MARKREKARDRKARAQGSGGDPTPAPPEDLGLPAGAAGDAFGEPVEPVEPVEESELEAEALQARGDLDDDGDIDEDDRALAAGAPAPARQRTAAPSVSSGPRFIQFIRGCWAELQRVQWPDRRQVAQATAVVLGFVVIAGTYLGVADWAADKLVDFIL
jgi:preprotein translocase subunit SecE